MLTSPAQSCISPLLGALDSKGASLARYRADRHCVKPLGYSRRAETNSLFAIVSRQGDAEQLSFQSTGCQSTRVIMALGHTYTLCVRFHISHRKELAVHNDPIHCTSSHQLCDVADCKFQCASGMLAKYDTISSTPCPCIAPVLYIYPGARS